MRYNNPMSRKDYMQIAKIIRGLVINESQSQDLLYELTIQLCNYFSKEDERFDIKKFLKACGFEVASERY